ncbi:MAG: Uma2 family endonuclease [Treponema sp.]|jgi:Uma2 family endonuclease|nr:Uma2 family endonuclease [Treponema sp.]
MADGAVLEKPVENSRNFTYADYKNWNPGEGRYELIYGTAYAMAGPNTSHQTILMELAKQLALFLTGKPCRVLPAPYDVRLFYAEDESDDTVVQPDIIVVCNREKLGKEGCRGAPDFVVEILSPSNTAIEMQRKFKLYRQAGVREYWVLDPESKTLHTHLFEDGRITSRFYGAGERASVEVLPGLEIALGPVFTE